MPLVVSRQITKVVLLVGKSAPTCECAGETGDHRSHSCLVSLAELTVFIMTKSRKLLKEHSGFGSNAVRRLDSLTSSH